MSITISEVTYFSEGVRLLSETARQKAQAFEAKVKAQLQSGGATSEEAEQVASSCRQSSTSHQLELLRHETIQVRMTKEEFEVVKKALGMEETQLR